MYWLRVWRWSYQPFYNIAINIRPRSSCGIRGTKGTIWMLDFLEECIYLEWEFKGKTDPQHLADIETHRPTFPTSGREWHSSSPDWAVWFFVFFWKGGQARVWHLPFLSLRHDWDFSFGWVLECILHHFKISRYPSSQPTHRGCPMRVFRDSKCKVATQKEVHVSN